MSFFEEEPDQARRHRNEVRVAKIRSAMEHHMNHPKTTDDDRLHHIESTVSIELRSVFCEDFSDEKPFIGRIWLEGSCQIQAFTSTERGLHCTNHQYGHQFQSRLNRARTHVEQRVTIYSSAYECS